MSDEATLDVIADVLRGYPQAPRIHVALSGGLDSHCLLHWLSHSPFRDRLSALHVHHGLQPAADHWAEICAGQCAARCVPFELLKLHLAPRPGESVEAVARDARYHALRDRLGPGELLLTAHHRDDQAETVLLQLFRGCGVPGIAGMAPDQPLGPGRHLRPMLDVDRATLTDYARRAGLDWVEDPMNQDRHLSRAYLRHEVLPAVRAHWPGFTRALARSAHHAAEATDLLGQLARADLERMGWTPAHGTALDIQRLSELNLSRQRNVLRFWLGACGVRPPSQSRLQRVLDEVMQARPGRQPRVAWSNVSVWRHRGQLVLVRALPPVDPGFKADLELDQVLELQDGSRVWLESRTDGLLDAGRLTEHNLCVAYRRAGVRLRTPLGAGSSSVSRLLQSAGVPVWLRSRIPILYQGEQVVAVGERWIDRRYMSRPGRPAVSFRWQNESLFDTLLARIQSGRSDTDRTT